MQRSKQNILAIVTFLALVVVLAIQVNWLFNAAKIEEERFNYFVNLALTEAKDEIGKTAKKCSDMNDFLCGVPGKETIREKKIAEIDSIITSKLEKYNINLDYTFDVSEIDSEVGSKKFFGQKCYLKCLNGMLEKEGIKIMLEFPGRNQFLLAQLRGTFLLAFFSIIFVMISFFITSRMFMKERQMMEQTTDFINNMVHEFQTPLSNIRFAANLIKKREDKIDDPKITEYLSVIIQENHKMENNVVEILKISSNSNGHTYEPVDLIGVLRQICREFKPRIESLNGKLNCYSDHSELIISGVPEHFKLIFSNLIDNAIKYSEESPKVDINLGVTSKNIFITIKDQGIGIDKRYQSKIFEKYYRVPTGDVHNVKGFGLGLTFVKKIIEGYKGKIEVSSSKGTGTLFTIFLPLGDETDKNTIG